VNRVELEGIATTDGKKPSEKSPVCFALRTGGDSKQHPSQTHQVIAWNEPAAVGVRHGDAVRVVGELRYTSWKDPRGVLHTRAEIHASHIAINLPKEKPLTPKAYGGQR
jgi:single-stranded DNA-binding protein